MGLFILFLFIFSIEKILSQNCLLPGNDLLIGASLISNNGLYNLTVTSRGNVCVFDITSKRWCSGFLSPSAWKMSLTDSGIFAVVKTNGITVWAPNAPVTSDMHNIAYAIISDNANFIVYNNAGLIWSCYRGTFSKYYKPSCNITSPTESIGDTCNNIPSFSPTLIPTFSPTSFPTSIPTLIPTLSPTFSPTRSPTKTPTRIPTTTRSPTAPAKRGVPTFKPIISPTAIPSNPTVEPTVSPTISPTLNPSLFPTTEPTASPI